MDSYIGNITLYLLKCLTSRSSVEKGMAVTPQAKYVVFTCRLLNKGLLHVGKIAFVIRKRCHTPTCTLHTIRILYITFVQKSRFWHDYFFDKHNDLFTEGQRMFDVIWQQILRTSNTLSLRQICKYLGKVIRIKLFYK